MQRQEVVMSHRHQDDQSPRLSSVEQRAHAHAERHRIKSELRILADSVGRSLDVDDCDEPAVEWKPVHHHDAQHAADKTAKRRIPRHWKLKQWKRRTTNRRQRVDIQRRIADDQ